MINQKNLLKILKDGVIVFLLGLSINLSLAQAETPDQNDPCQNYTDKNQKAACESFVGQYKVPSPPREASVQTSTTETKSQWGFKSIQPKKPAMPGIIPAPQNPLVVPQQLPQNTITPLFNITVLPPNTGNTQKPITKIVPPNQPAITPEPVMSPPAASTTATSSPVTNVAPVQPKTPTQFFDQGQTGNQTKQNFYQ